jgi:CheY-like chemotaxis protein
MVWTVERCPAMGKTLLLIEDSITTQKAVTMAFESDDVDIITANDAIEGLHELRTLVPEIILADASMPDIDGFQLCQLVRGTDSVRHVPVLLLTSSFTTYDTEKGDRVGVTAHLSKPFEPQALRHLVQQLVAKPHHAPGPPETPASASTDAPGWSAESLAALSPATASPVDEATTSRMLSQALGSSVIQTIRDSLHTHVGRMVEQITPQIVETVRDVVDAKMPELLEVLLQREIEKLKQAVEHDEPHGDQ